MRGVFRPLLDAQEQAKRLAAQMETLADRAGGDYKTLSAEYGRLQSYFETNDGYNIDVKINTVLNGMGLSLIHIWIESQAYSLFYSTI